MLKILSYNVYGMERAVLASGLPMQATSKDVLDENDYKRASKLGSVASGTGHDSMLKGVLVSARIKYPLYWTKQFQRYHFADIVSSQSTMHRITKFDIKKQCNEYVDDRVIEILQEYIDGYNRGQKEQWDDDSYYHIQTWATSNYFIGVLDDFYLDEDNYKVKRYTRQELFMAIISNIPSGLEMEMEIVTNYLQLKTIYNQRKNHKLYDWKEFCDWCESLPNFKEFCLGGK